MNDSTATIEAPAVETPTPVEAPVAEAAPEQKGFETTNEGRPCFLRTDLARLFELLGYADATAWLPARMMKKISQFPELEKDPAFVGFRDKMAPEYLGLYNRLHELLIAKAEVEIVGAAEAKKRGKGKPAKAAKAPKAAKAKKSSPGGPPSRKTGNRDAFGSSPGTRGFEAMTLLNRDTPLKISDMAKTLKREGEFLGVFYNFLNAQVVKGNVKKSDKGYTLTAAGERAKQKHAAALAGQPEPAAEPEATPAPEATPEAAPVEAAAV